METGMKLCCLHSNKVIISITSFRIRPRPFFMPSIPEIKAVIFQLYEKGFEKAVQNLIKRKQKQKKY
jgi:hypothetical protein